MTGRSRRYASASPWLARSPERTSTSADQPAAAIISL